MRAGLTVLVVLATLGCTLGCGTLLPPQRTAEAFAEREGVRSDGGKLGLEVLTVPEGQRVMLIKSPDDVERVCAPRESDEGVSVSEGLNLSLPGAGAAGIGEQAGVQAVSLGRPGPIVQLARELLFRACELSLNLDADATETRAIYERFLSTLESIAPSLAPAQQSSDDDDGN
jgi:hypothetical protein